MASGKQSPRQKMVNLMYLVFICMLALNMSKEVLSAFGFMNEKLTENNASTTIKNNDAYANLATKASEQAAKFGKKGVWVDGRGKQVNDWKGKLRKVWFKDERKINAQKNETDKD